MIQKINQFVVNRFSFDKFLNRIKHKQLMLQIGASELLEFIEIDGVEKVAKKVGAVGFKNGLQRKLLVLAKTVTHDLSES